MLAGLREKVNSCLLEATAWPPAPAPATAQRRPLPLLQPSSPMSHRLLAVTLLVINAPLQLFCPRGCRLLPAPFLLHLRQSHKQDKRGGESLTLMFCPEAPAPPWLASHHTAGLGHHRARAQPHQASRASISLAVPDRPSLSLTLSICKKCPLSPTPY